jgi:exodeoxyribonuclease-3
METTKRDDPPRRNAMRLKIASWNINSVRLRIGLVERYLREQSPDVLCLQETKCRDAEFPAHAFRQFGYPHIAINGQKGYHGVATVSRLPFLAIDKREFCAKGDARHVSIDLKDPHGSASPLTIHNFYIPAGGDEPNPDINPKFAHKLQFLDELTDWIGEAKLAANHAIMVGDLNVAPLESDVWNHKALMKVVSHTPIEVAKLTSVFESGRWFDALRAVIPPEQKLYTWWSYRSPNWELANKGRRLDHIWLSPSLAPALDCVTVHRAARGWPQPSDHVPVEAVLDFSKPAGG